MKSYLKIFLSKKVILVIFVLISVESVCQIQKQKINFPIGFYTKENVNIFGLSLGLRSKILEKKSKTFGLRLEPFGSGMFILFASNTYSFPDYQKNFGNKEIDIPNEIINGINLSTGTITYANVNGISISSGIQALRKVNGISFAFSNSSFEHIGIQLGLFGSSAYKMTGLSLSAMNSDIKNGQGVQISGFNNTTNFIGLQIGIWNGIENKNNIFKGLQIGLQNNAGNLKGIQIGLWNKNSKRSLPFLNWNFKN
ncbi:hypothetical protein [uncultured Polaribacter sp.]|uniref:LA_2272 family surface repeat-containing protein n=1 Tax=uncultured Polaribacter sp. TaxID=174711 RepID=UPI00262D4DB0|nr:hypothetical protein [uncultured Polaribacter sp.]